MELWWDFLFWVTPGLAQGSLLALCLGITSGLAQVTIHGVKDQTTQNLNLCILFLAQHCSNVINFNMVDSICIFLNYLTLSFLNFFLDCSNHMHFSKTFLLSEHFCYFFFICCFPRTSTLVLHKRNEGGHSFIWQWSHWKNSKKLALICSRTFFDQRSLLVLIFHKWLLNKVNRHKSLSFPACQKMVRVKIQNLHLFLYLILVSGIHCLFLLS